MALLALASAGGILAFGERPLAIAVPAALALGLVLGRSARVDGRDPEEIAAQLEETQRQLESLALRDPLTGVLNHRGFQDALEVELRRARRESWSVAIVAADVDGFRKLNDSRGHEYGDAVLTAVAQGLSTDLRPGDLCGRVGGDEFMLALTGPRRSSTGCARRWRPAPRRPTWSRSRSAWGSPSSPATPLAARS